MFIYFDRNGVLQEVINDKAARLGDLNANEIYVYVDEVELDDIWLTLKRPDGTLSVEKSFIANKVVREIPYDPKRDMKFFKDYKEYEFYKFTISDEITIAGVYQATIRMTYEDTLSALGVLVFKAETGVIKSDQNITQAQYDYLIWYVGSWQGQIGDLEEAMGITQADILGLKNRMNVAEQDIDKIEDGTTIVGKALADSLGNVVKDSYVSAVYPTYNTTTDKLFIETYSVEDGLMANNEVVLPKATATKNGLMSKEHVNDIADLKANKADLVSGKIPASQLPGFVDDVIIIVFTTIYNDNNPIPTYTLEIGRTKYALYRTHPDDPYGKVQIWKRGPNYTDTWEYERDADLSAIYVGEQNNRTYRLPNINATELMEISQSLALGETFQTAYRGDRGKVAYDHSQEQGNAHNLNPDEISYDGTISGLSSTNVKTAIDEVASEKTDKTYVDAQDALKADLAVSNVFTQPQQVPNATLPQHTVNKLQVETMFEMFKQQLRGYNLASPNLTNKTEISAGVYRLYDANGIIVDYNSSNGFWLFNGTALSTFNITFTNNITMGVLKAQMLEISGDATKSYSGYYFANYSNAQGRIYYNTSSSSDNVKTKTLEKTVSYSDLLFSISDGLTFTNFKFKLKLEKGSTATPYTLPGQIPQYKIVGEE